MYIEHLVTGVPQGSVLRPLLFSTSSLGSDRHKQLNIHSNVLIWPKSKLGKNYKYSCEKQKRRKKWAL